MVIFTLEKKLQDKNIDWEWLKNQNHMHNSEYVNIIELEQPLTIKIDGIKGDGVIIKPKLILIQWMKMNQVEYNLF